MCKKNCKCMCNCNKKECCPNGQCCVDGPCCDGYVEESKYLFAKEMYQHYKELYEVALSELKFKSLNVDHLLQTLEDVVVLLGNNRKPLMIAKVIDNAIDRYNIDINIHNSMIADGQTSFADIVGDIEDDLDEESYNEDNEA